MSFLDWPHQTENQSRRWQQRRKAVATRLIDQFAHVFCDIRYDLFWDSSFINAQAWLDGSQRHVTLYGGLVRHPAITAPGLALILAHETGHHLGGKPTDPALRWATWQGQADYWAASEGMPKVFGPKAFDVTLRGARQIAALHREFEDDAPDISPQDRSAIFRAGARGDTIPDLLDTLFQKMMRERNDTDD